MANTEKINDILATIASPEEALAVIEAAREKFNLIGKDFPLGEIERIHERHSPYRLFDSEETERADELNLLLQDLKPGIVTEIATTSRKSIESAMSKCGTLATVNANRDIHAVIGNPAVNVPVIATLTTTDPFDGAVVDGSTTELFVREFDDLLEAHRWGNFSRGRSVGELRADGWTTNGYFHNGVIVTGHSITITGTNGRAVKLAAI